MATTTAAASTATTTTADKSGTIFTQNTLESHVGAGIALFFIIFYVTDFILLSLMQAKDKKERQQFILGEPQSPLMIETPLSSDEV
ncbi:uncharacterized protein K452DRAFT_298877 [Aplosporella prunicola CBS 121167]|uniref:Uncharacterized protein n=1 Tax=Aplosporella prunicola CBS 121167 TaxID=1176127 RepID=A0A6A6BBD6_9PEZI|nr:uncharacterized protein K452DRAFT_298877 [Aplosporella prunicola CBS 121167]KAF2141519.1 hypothetical protein K452DRAFT_298877 [Aplosporella prunicola CBS 121167]